MHYKQDLNYFKRLARPDKVRKMRCQENLYISRLMKHSFLNA